MLSARTELDPRIETLVLNDITYALRMLRKNPGFTAVAACSLAIGIGANSAVFSFADAMLLRPLPVMRPSEIVGVNYGPSSFGGNRTFSYPDYLDLRDRNRSFDGLVAFQYATVGYAKNRTVVPEMQFGVFVSANFFKLLGVEPNLGRGFRASEEQAPGRDRVAVLSHDFWLAHFDGSKEAIGSKIVLNGTEFTVVGIAPASFHGIDQLLKPALYVPITVSSALSGDNNLNHRDNRWLQIKGRLKPGVTNARAEADLNAIMKALEQAYSSEPRDQKVVVETELQLRVDQSPPDAQLIEMLVLLAGCVLLVACANVAGLLLSRSAARGREIAVRLSVGAARWQLVRQLFLENLALALLGGVLGIAIALAGIKLFASIPIPSDVPITFDIKLDDRVLIFTLLASVVSTFLFGLAPALRSSRADVTSALRARDTDGSRRTRLWGRNVLVSAQLAVSLLLLVISTVVFLGFRRELAQGPGFQTDHLFLMSFDSQMAHDTPAQSEQFFKQLLDRTRSMPGVRSATLVSTVPLGMNGSTKPVLPEGRTLKRGEQPFVTFEEVASDGYFETMHIPILRGRGFLPTDKANTTKVAVVNQNFANHFWPKQDALGKRFHLQDANGPLVEIVGIAKSSKYLWISEPPMDFLYLPFSQNPQNTMSLVTESPSADASWLAPELRALVHSIDPNMPAFDVRTMHDLFTKRAVQTPNVLVAAVGGMGSMAFALAVIGLYGLIAYSVSRRTREIGVRMAIGADRRGVLRMILRQGLVLAGLGLGAGLVLSIAISRILGSVMAFSFGATNPALFAAVVLPLFGVALLASYGPARRASRIDPMMALRDE